MKKNVSTHILLWLLVVVMTGCSATNGSSTRTENVGSPTSGLHEQGGSSQPKAPSSSTDEILPEESAETPPSVTDESLLTEAEGPVPDFLDEHQQALYRQAKTAFIEFTLDNSGFGSSGSDGPELEQNDMQYYKCNGAITKWSSFETAMLSVFTLAYFKELNNGASYTDGDGAYHERTIFTEQNGDLYYSGGARGGGITFLEPETFELISETNSEIQFYVVGTYDDFATDANGNFIDAGTGDLQRAGNPTTEKHLIVMENSSGDWRFSKFQLAY